MIVFILILIYLFKYFLSDLINLNKMKLLNLQKNTTLALLLFVLILLNDYVESFTSLDKDAFNNFKNLRKDINKISELKNKKKTHLKIQKKNFNLKSTEKDLTNNSDITEEQLQFIENITKSQQKNESFMYASWFIFVPLVLLIFIMTILSIAGFLILILNSTNTNTTLDKKEMLRSQINRLNRSNLSNQEILDILRTKHNKKNKKKSHSNYKPEPEPETILLGI